MIGRLSMNARCRATSLGRWIRCSRFHSDRAFSIAPTVLNVALSRTYCQVPYSARTMASSLTVATPILMVRCLVRPSATMTSTSTTAIS